MKGVDCESELCVREVERQHLSRSQSKKCGGNFATTQKAPQVECRQEINDAGVRGDANFGNVRPATQISVTSARRRYTSETRVTPHHCVAVNDRCGCCYGDRGTETTRTADRQTYAGRETCFMTPGLSHQTCYFRWFETSFVISNIETCFLPPKTTFSFSSALMLRRFLLS